MMVVDGHFTQGDSMVPEGWSIDPGLTDETSFLYPSWWNDLLGNWPSLCGLQAETYDQYYKEFSGELNE
ncbi:hypothetical protein LCGC14_1116940 [marine sediment metagenome]|uniref:Uncharacterized protein n=1 Tax=marine sediment metagenome TaxID=412755 RepID=A0A0F9MT07_9ZZZZ